METRAKDPLEIQLLNFAADKKNHNQLSEFVFFLKAIKNEQDWVTLTTFNTFFIDHLFKKTYFPHINAMNKAGYNTLHYLSHYGATQLLEQLIDAKADLDIPTVKQSDTALILAATQGHEKCLQLLLSNKANVNLSNKNNFSPLDSAIRGGHTGSATILIEAGADLEHINGDDSSPLTEALLTDNFDIVLKLLEFNVKIDNPIMLYYFLKKQDKTDPRINDYLGFLKIQNCRELKSISALGERRFIVIPFILDIGKLFKNLTAYNKIDMVVERLHELCALLAKEKPNLLWIVSWREYGIEDENTNSISDAAKCYLKKAMLEISKQYPNLIIIAGSVLTRKTQKIADLPKILAYYDELAWLEEIENSYDDKQQHQISLHKNVIHSLLTTKKEDESIEVTSNKIRIYHGEEIRHGKITPCYENSQLSNPVVYQPAKGNNLSPIVKINQDLFAFSICREISTGFELIKKFNKTRENILFQFLISRSIDIFLKSAYSKFSLMHFDNRYDPRLVLTRGYQSVNVDVEMYPYDVTQKIEALDYRAIPVYPLQFQIIDKINNELKTLSDVTQKQELIQLKKKILQILPKYLISQTEYTNCLILLESKKTILDKDFINQLIEIIKKNKKQLNFSLPKNPMKSSNTATIPHPMKFFTPSKQKNIVEQFKIFFQWWQPLCAHKEYQFIVDRLKQCFDIILAKQSNPMEILSTRIHQIQIELRRIPYSKDFLSKSISEKRKINDILIDLRKWIDSLSELTGATKTSSLRLSI